jgi:hypothetical protein
MLAELDSRYTALQVELLHAECADRDVRPCFPRFSSCITPLDGMAGVFHKVGYTGGILHCNVCAGLCSVGYARGFSPMSGMPGGFPQCGLCQMVFPHVGYTRGFLQCRVCQVLPQIRVCQGFSSIQNARGGFPKGRVFQGVSSGGYPMGFSLKEEDCLIGISSDALPSPTPSPSHTSPIPFANTCTAGNVASTCYSTTINSFSALGSLSDFPSNSSLILRLQVYKYYQVLSRADLEAPSEADFEK